MNSGISIDVSTRQARTPVTIFHVNGDIDGKTYEQLLAQANDAYNTGMRNLVLDLSKVPYISSAGLRAIHTIYTLLRTDAPGESDEMVSKGLLDGTFKSPHLKLLNPAPNVLDTLKMAGFDMYLAIYRNLDEALASF